MTRWVQTRCSRAWSSSTAPTSSPAGCVHGCRARLLRPVALNWTTDGTDIDFRVAVQAADRLRRAQRHHRAVRQRFPRPVPRVRRHLDAEGPQSPAPVRPSGSTPLRVRRRGGDAAPPAEVGHQGVKRVTAGSPSAASSCGPPTGTDRPARRQGVWLPAAGRTADVGAAPGHPHHQRQTWLLLFGPFAGWSPKFLKQGTHHRSAGQREARQPGLHDRGSG